MPIVSPDVNVNELFEKRFSRRLDESPDTFAPFIEGDDSRHTEEEAKMSDAADLLHFTLSNPPHPWKMDLTQISGPIYEIRHFRGLTVKDFTVVSELDVKVSTYPIFVGGSGSAVGSKVRTTSRQSKEVILEGGHRKGRFTDKTLWNAPVVIGDVIGNFQIFDKDGNYKSIIGTYINGIDGIYLTYTPAEIAQRLSISYGFLGRLLGRKSAAVKIIEESIRRCAENLNLFQAMSVDLGGLHEALDLIDDLVLIAGKKKVSVKTLLMNNALRI